MHNNRAACLVYILADKYKKTAFQSALIPQHRFNKKLVASIIQVFFLLKQWVSAGPLHQLAV